ncbi:MAG: DUF4911 domain-containing protein [Candidatus Bipolaricaulia bacterium]
MKTLLVELEEREIHFLGAIIEGYDGIAALSRDYELVDGKTCFRLLVGPGFEEEVEHLLWELRGYARIGEVREAPPG